MIRVLALTRYDWLGASSRVRFLQYLPLLAQRGITVEAAPLLSNRYVERLYGQQPRPLGEIAAGYVHRLARMLDAPGFDTVWLDEEVFPWLPWPFEALLRRRARRLVVDCDDARWLRYADHSSALVRRCLGGKIDRLMASADMVVAGNAWLAEHARAAGATASVLPSTVDLDRYRARPERPPGPVFTIGWIGSPSTAGYLQVVAGVLAELARRRPLRLVCVGAQVTLQGVDVECRPWSLDREVEEIGGFDAGIMPLTDGPWERGKCAYKLIQYMACGVPALGSAVGANRELIRHGENGLLAGDARQWTAALERLMDEPDLRSALGRAGRRTVEESFSVQRRVDDLAALLRSACTP